MSEADKTASLDDATIKANASRVQVWSAGMSENFNNMDKNKDGYVTASEARNCLQDQACALRAPTPGTTSLRAFEKNADDLHISQNLGDVACRAFHYLWDKVSPSAKKDGLAPGDLVELERRARELPTEMETTAKIASVYNKYFERVGGGGYELRSMHFDSIKNSPSLSPEEKAVFKEIHDYWPRFKHDIGNTLNHDEAIMGSELPERAASHLVYLRQQFEIVQKVANDLK